MRSRSTHDLGSSQIGSLEALNEARISRLGLLNRSRMSDVRQSRCDLDLLVRRVLSETHQAFSRLVDLVSPYGIPWRFRSEVGSDQKWNWPDPLESKWQAPS